MSEAPKSPTRLDFEKSVREKNWYQAYRDFNGMNMYEMLRSYRDLDTTTRRTFWDQRDKTTQLSGQAGAGCNLNTPSRNVLNTTPGERDRMKYAVDVVNAQQMPDGDPPGDLRATGQEEDAREFLAPAPTKLAQITFVQFSNVYPRGNPAQVKALIGGHIAMDGTITNTCAIRISRVLNKNGFPIPGHWPGLTTQTGSDKLWYARYQKQLTSWIETQFGSPSLMLSKPVSRRKLFNLQGFIGFDIPFQDATGHIDLWDGEDFGTELEATHDYFAIANSVKFWRIPNWRRL